MAEKTTNLELTKPDPDDSIDVSVFNDNFDIIDDAIAEKVDKEEGKGLSTNDFTDADKSKLDGLSNYDDTEIPSSISALQTALNALAARVEALEGATIENGGINFLGETSFSNNFRLRSDFSKAKISTPDTGTLDSNEGIFMMITPDYDSYQNWEYKIQVTFTGEQSYPICVLGSKGDYYSNPTMEIHDNNTLWFGVTKNSYNWQHSIDITTSEPFTSGKTYDFYLGWDGEEIYCKAYDVDTNTLVAIETITSSTNPQRNPNSGSNPCILNNGNASRFRLLGTVNLMNCYFKANGEILWGGET